MRVAGLEFRDGGLLDRRVILEGEVEMAAAYVAQHCIRNMYAESAKVVLVKMSRRLPSGACCVRQAYHASDSLACGTQQ